jgi:NADH dehydrogenase
MGELKRIVVVGAGFGGLTFCEHFNHKAAQVTVVDRTNHHLFQPLLYQVAMAGLGATDIAQPIRSILGNRSNITVLLDEVQDFDLQGRRVICQKKVLPYDYLLLGFGSVTSYFGHAEWAEHAPGLKTIEDALLIRRNVLLAFEKAENESDPQERARLMTIVIVGGGPTGVELAGACSELAHHVLKRDFRSIDPGRARIIMVEAAPKILLTFPPDLSEKARLKLEKLKVEVMTSAKVKDISHGCLTLESGQRIEAENILWGAGVMAHPLAKKLNVPLDRAGRVRVEPDLSLPSHPEVFALGDLASIMQEDGKPVPGVAPAAMQMARHVAGMLTAELDGKSPARTAFRYHNKGNLATIGRSAGVAVIGKLKFDGVPAWLAWLLVHLVFLIGFRNKLVVLISWTYSYFTYKRGARIITGWPESLSHKEAAETPSRLEQKPERNLIWR